ncbi:MAG: calcium-translocating P-type ATPase, SERCA-type [Nanoarchaeota archaeon]|nr:calcium-translocating P-type ATPase, SERCA-type [Nanoarchaeota archaeon]
MHNKELNEVYKELNTSKKGLSSDEAKKRLEKYGPNTIKGKKGIHPIKIFISQFKNFIVGILIAAMFISYFIGEKLDAWVIFAILILNAILGFIQEYKAEKAIEALKKMASLSAVVIRDGKEEQINAAELVPGDIIVLSVGEKVPADCRLTESINLKSQESVLTGESTSVNKNLKVLGEKTVIADRKNMVFSGTVITAGRGRAIVSSTGMDTEIGKIAGMIQAEKPKLTPLQVKLASLGKFLGIITLNVCAAVFLVGILSGRGLYEMFFAAVSLAVAAIPEGLPAVVTISLALGVQRMIKRNALVRKLPSVETLGSTTVICTDKTGTLTCNEMTVRKLFVNNEVIDVTGEGYSAKGKFIYDGKEVDSKSFDLMLKIGALNNDGKINNDKFIGDPTELSLIVSAKKAGLSTDVLEKDYKRINEMGFTSERKRMSTLHQTSGKNIVFCKGAPDVILDLCDNVLVDGSVKKLTKGEKERILGINEDFAKNALRVLGFAYKEEDKISEKNMIFVGLQAMIDPPREGVREAIEKCKDAGIKVVMITGDHITTALAVAKEIGIEGKAISGQQLGSASNLAKIVDEISIYARVDPEHKSKIVDALRKKGHIIAMTGDGVNDAPALKKADIGIAMGIAGTDVAKEASDMILTDDKFTSIVNAIEEGRGVYDNIKKFFAFLISGNLGEVMVIFLAIIVGLPLPLTATQILLINLVTDGLPAVALGADPFEPNAMKRKPRSKDERIYKNLNHFVIYYPIIMIVITLGLFYFVYKTSGNLIKAQTVAFLTIAMFEMYQAFASRSTIYSSFKVGIFKNKWLVIAVLTSIVITLAAIYVPFLQGLFDTFPLGIRDVVMIVVLSSLGFIYLESYKAIKSRKEELV